ncbi:hypothetical protein [Parabacteroides sp.]
MAIKKIPWITGDGNIVIDFSGQGNDAISISSDTENSGSDRQQDITFRTTKGTPIEIVRTIKQEGNLKPVDGVSIFRNCGKDGDLYVNDILIRTISAGNINYFEGLTLKPGDIVEIRNATLGTETTGIPGELFSILYDYDPINKTYTELRGLPSIFRNNYFFPAPVLRLSDLPEGHYYAVAMVMAGPPNMFFPAAGVDITTSPPALELEYNNKYVVTGNEEMTMTGDKQYTYIPFITASNWDNLNVEYTGRKAYAAIGFIALYEGSSYDYDGNYLLLKEPIEGFCRWEKFPEYGYMSFIKVIE